MNMTWEEAIMRINAHIAHHRIGEYPHIKLAEALEMAISALRPVRREQVDQVRAHWITVIDTSGRSWSKCSGCQKELDGMEDAYDFCPHCGAPMTDEAVDILLKRLETLKDGPGNR